MIRLVLVGLWACLVVVGAVYAGVTLKMFEPAAEKPSHSKLETLEMKPVSVPIVRDNKIEGHLVLRFSLVVDAGLRHASVAKVEDLVADEILRSTIGTSLVTIPKDLAALPAKVQSNVNQRVNANILNQIIVREWAFAGKRESRK